MLGSLYRSSSLSTLSNTNESFRISGAMSQKFLASSGQSIGATSLIPSTDWIMGHEKYYMQNLNSRLASYMEKVLSLEKANLKLEQKITEFYGSRSSISRTDLSKYYIIIEDLQKQIISKAVEKQQVFTTLDNAALTASDFNMKLENEKSMRLAVEADLTRLRTLQGETEWASKHLQIQKTGLEEELIFLKKSHEESMLMVRTQQSGAVNVQVDCAQAVNLNKELDEMREQYETLILKNSQEVEQWFKSKVQTWNTEVHESHTEIRSSQKAFSERNKTYQSMEIEMKGIQTQIHSLQTDLVQVESRYSEQVSQLQVYIDRLQTELQHITANMQQQANEYELLLNIKMRLEQEIEEYRRLLGEELHRSIIQETETSKATSVTETIVVETEEKEEVKHLHQKRVKIITEDLLDGVVVATSVKESVQEL